MKCSDEEKGVTFLIFVSTAADDSHDENYISMAPSAAVRVKSHWMGESPWQQSLGYRLLIKKLLLYKF